MYVTKIQCACTPSNTPLVLVPSNPSRGGLLIDYLPLVHYLASLASSVSTHFTPYGMEMNPEDVVQNYYVQRDRHLAPTLLKAEKVAVLSFSCRPILELSTGAVLRIKK